MMISNLTEGELEVLKALKEIGPVRYKSTAISKRLGKRKSWISRILKRLCKFGHVIKLHRGEYIIAEGVNL